MENENQIDTYSTVLTRANLARHQFEPVNTMISIIVLTTIGWSESENRKFIHEFVAVDKTRIGSDRIGWYNRV